MTETEIKRVTLQSLNDVQPSDPDDEYEFRLIKNILHVMEGYSVETSMSALVRVLESLLVGTFPDKEMTLAQVSKIATHLKGEIRKKQPYQFGYIHDDQPSNEPIIAKGDKP